MMIRLLALAAVAAVGASSDMVLDGRQLADGFVCPLAAANEYFYNTQIDIAGYEANSLFACTEAERRQIGSFLDEHFDVHLSNSGLLNGELTELQTRSIVCADSSTDPEAGGGRELWIGWRYVGGGDCRSCGGDDSDRRRLQTASFDDLKAELEPTLSDALTTGLINEFVLQEGREVSCLLAQVNLSVVVTLEEAASATDISNPCNTDPNFCCAPKGDVLADCSKDRNNRDSSEWWCNQGEWRCTDNCGGFWADQENPPTCLSLWQECETGDDCCGDENICQGDQWYKQCREAPTEEAAPTEEVGTCLPLWNRCETGDNCCGDENTCKGDQWYKQCRGAN